MNDNNLIIKREYINDGGFEEFGLGLGVLITILDFAQHFSDEQTFDEVCFWLSTLGYSNDECDKLFPKIKMISSIFEQKFFSNSDGDING